MAVKALWYSLSKLGGRHITLQAFKTLSRTLAASGVVALGCVAFLSHAALAKQLNDWQVLPRPEHFTELYFTHYHELPTSLRAGVKGKLDFTVHNHEHQTTTYRYQVSALTADSSVGQTLSEGNFTLPVDQTWTIDQTVTLPLPNKRVAVRVNVEYAGMSPGSTISSAQTQSIQYWVDVLDPPHTVVKQVEHAAKK